MQDFWNQLIANSVDCSYKDYMTPRLKKQIRDLSQVVIYGAGNLGKYLFDWIQEMGGNVLYFLDRNAKEIKMYCNRPVYPLERKISETIGEGVTVLVSPFLEAEQMQAISQQIKNAGYESVIANYSVIAVGCPWITNLQEYPIQKLFLENQCKILETTSLLKDDRSKEIFRSHLQKHGQYEYQNTTIDSDLVQYFDLDFVMKKGYSAFIDCGAYVGDSFCELVKRYAIAEYYGFEPANQTFIELSKQVNQIQKDKSVYGTICLFPCATGKKCEFARFNDSKKTGSKLEQTGDGVVQVVTLDDVIKSKNITMLKMDVEGAEIDTLHGAKELITSQKPDLAICVYHNISDIWEISLLLHAWVPEYIFYLRVHNNATMETVLYATIGE